MLTRIALVSPPGPELESIRSILRNPMKYTVREFLSMSAVNQDLKSFPMEVLIMRYPSFEEKHVTVARTARDRFRNAELIFLSPNVVPAARAASGSIGRFRLLEEPAETQDLAAVVDKLVRGDSALSRLHPRAPREDRVQLIDQTGMIHRGQFLDFAQMGARVAFSSIARLKAKESVQVVYTSSTDASKLNRIEAKIVWSNLTGGFVDQFMGVKQQSVGLRFIASY